jgi:hypothetical protein
MVCCSCVVVKTSDTLLDTSPSTTHSNTVDHLNIPVISDDTTDCVVSDNTMGPAISAGAHTYRSDTFQVLKLDSVTSQVLKVDLGNGHAISDGAAGDVVPDATVSFSRTVLLPLTFVSSPTA